MKTLYFDCIAGASGDMILGAIVDTGLISLVDFRQCISALHLAGFEIQARKVVKGAFAATKIDIMVSDEVSERRLDDILAIVAQSDLPSSVREQAAEIIRRIGVAEANIHGLPLEEVHLHELGGVDTIVDVVGVLVGIEMLGIERIVVSTIPLGRGFISGAHGSIPLPAPATIALLQGAPVTGSSLEAETVTPTGAALLTSLADNFGAIPPMTLTAVGYGAGSYDFSIPNVLRVLVGEGASTTEHTHRRPSQQSRSYLETKHLKVLETNIDDLNPEVYEYVMETLFAAGALDVFLSPIQMKKNRPATLLRVLCKPSDVETMVAILFAETSTLGVREQTVDRHALPRTIASVETKYGAVHVKVAELGEGQVKCAPEYADCRRLAELNHVPLREVYQAAQVIARHKFGRKEDLAIFAQRRAQSP